jgi:predicted SAM-dependent methyltransferase
MKLSDRDAVRNATTVRRLNWGCGEHIAPGWINSDVKEASEVDLVADIREGLPLASDSLDYAVSVHALPELSYPDLIPALMELRRVLKPGGVLRLVLPDLDRALAAYQERDSAYFKVDPAEVQSLGGRLIVQMLWYGYSRSLFTADFARELLEKAGFDGVELRHFRMTGSTFAEIVELDNREDESFYIEATKASGHAFRSRRPYNRTVSGEMEILDIVQAPGERVKGHFRVRMDEGEKLGIFGWVLGQVSPATEVEVLVGGDLAGRSPVNLDRPDVAENFPDKAEAATAGFQIDLAASGKGESQLDVWVLLEDGSREPLGRIVVKASRRGLLGAFRRD